MGCDRCGNQTVTFGLCLPCAAVLDGRFGPPPFHPQVAPPGFVLALAGRIADQSELLSKKAEAQPVVISETYYCPL